MSPGAPPISGRTGNSTKAAAIARTAAAVVPRTKRLTRLLTDAPSEVTPASLSSAATSLRPHRLRQEPMRRAFQARPAARRRFVPYACCSPSSWADYQPLTISLSIRRCPLLHKNSHNRHTPVTERSVALHAPRSPKCPHSAAGSKLPSVSSGLDLGPKYQGWVVLYRPVARRSSPLRHD